MEGQSQHTGEISVEFSKGLRTVLRAVGAYLGLELGVIKLAQKLMMFVVRQIWIHVLNIGLQIHRVDVAQVRHTTRVHRALVRRGAGACLRRWRMMVLILLLGRPLFLCLLRRTILLLLIHLDVKLECRYGIGRV